MSRARKSVDFLPLIIKVGALFFLSASLSLSLFRHEIARYGWLPLASNLSQFAVPFSG